MRDIENVLMFGKQVLDPMIELENLGMLITSRRVNTLLEEAESLLVSVFSPF